jgi:uncharacterized C2H2 Zn-finger protein
MKEPHNRMARAETRAPVPVERVLVTPPPESVVRCPHCGAARVGQWRVVGSMPRTGEHRKRCLACGVVVVMSLDYKTIRVVA